MSYPPGGPPPPYYPGYPPPPGSYPHHMPGVAYVPAVPVPMPMYPAANPAPDPNVSQPTYVTNYVYHGSGNADTVRVVEDSIDWVQTTPFNAPQLSGRAVVAGYEGHDGSPLWVIRARHNNDLVPGKYAVKHRAAFIPFAGKEISVQDIEVMIAQPGAVRWVPSSHGAIPTGAIAAGNSANLEPLYIGRAHYMLSLTPGKAPGRASPKQFVEHRVVEIEERTAAVSKLKWAPSSHNVADDATHDIPRHFNQHHKWFTGPAVLYEGTEQ
ncbi:hypothetical protein EVAR_2910_1 [Eumeta japonica]|uniref:Uncharacterized protein n=1 Tax=Eumeta variegata TaxID=151549 RepID=A0A4C1T0U8_EUMVA|nr:hypothetical protein EVAR_2910_1 [Eumeta japonica]